MRQTNKLRRHAIIALSVGGVFGCESRDASSSPAPIPIEQSADCPVTVDEDAFEHAAEIDAIIDQAVLDGFAGQVAIMRDGALAYARAADAADLGGDIPVRDDTVFHVASITKYITAALVLRAQEQGRLDINDPISPFAPDALEPFQRITFAELLAHQSGLRSTYVTEGHDDPVKALKAIEKANPDLSRRGGFQYSNDGYDVLAIVLEQLYEAPFEHIAAREILGPACLANTRFWDNVDLTDAHIVSQPLKPYPATLRRRNYGMLGSSGLMTTATDLLRWQDAITSGRVLSRESIEQLFAPRGDTSIGQATYGAFQSEHDPLGRVISARGMEDRGDNAFLNDYPDCGLTIAIVTSRGPSEQSDAPLFRQQLLTALEPLLALQCANPQTQIF